MKFAVITFIFSVVLCCLDVDQSNAILCESCGCGVFCAKFFPPQKIFPLMVIKDKTASNCMSMRITLHVHIKLFQSCRLVLLSVAILHVYARGLLNFLFCSSSSQP